MTHTEVERTHVETLATRGNKCGPKLEQHVACKAKENDDRAVKKGVTDKRFRRQVVQRDDWCRKDWTEKGDTVEDGRHIAEGDRNENTMTLAERHKRFGKSPQSRAKTHTTVALRCQHEDTQKSPSR